MRYYWYRNNRRHKHTVPCHIRDYRHRSDTLSKALSPPSRPLSLSMVPSRRGRRGDKSRRRQAPGHTHPTCTRQTVKIYGNLRFFSRAKSRRL